MSKTMNRDKVIRDQLTALLRGGQAHDGLDEIVQGFPKALRGKRPGGVHSAWHLLEHIRIAQRDILDFSTSSDYEGRNWPDDYWPKTDAPPSSKAWDESIAQIRADLAAMQTLVADEGSDLYTPFPWGDGQNLLREAMLVADHNAYHLGQLALLKRLLGGVKD